MSAVAAWLGRTLGWSNSRQSWGEWLGVLALVLASVALAVFGRGLALSRQLLLWSALALAAAALARRGWLRLFGPVFFYDLVRLARRPRAYFARALYAGVLLAVLSWIYFLWVEETGTGMQAGQLALFAASFFSTFMVVQLAVAALVTPAVVAPAVAEEKERRTLEFLLATDLRGREIVLGKLAARVVSLLVLLLTGLPVLAALQFLGGIDPGLVLAGFAATGLTVASLAGLSVYNSATCRRARDAVALSYLMAATYLLLSGLSWLLLQPAGWADFPSTSDWTSPVTLTHLVEWFNAGNIISVLVQLAADVAANRPLDQVLPGYLAAYAAFHLTVAVLGAALAVLRLRPVAARQAEHGDGRRPRARRRVASESREPARTPQPARAGRALRRLGLATQPMLWKEVFAERGRGAPLLVRVFTWLLVVVSLAPTPVLLVMWLDGELSWFGSRNDSWDSLAAALNLFQVRVAGTAVALVLLLAVTVRAAGTVRGEHDRGTMDSLLTAPLDSDTILFAKWLGAILSARAGFLWLGAIAAIGILTGALHPVALALLTVTWLAYAAFAAGMGVWCSLRAKSGVRATVWALVGTVGLALGHWAVWLLCLPFLLLHTGAAPHVFEAVAKYQVGLTPPFVLGMMLSFRLDDAAEAFGSTDELAEMVAYALLGTFTWAVLAAGLWHLASAEFRAASGRAARVPPRLRPAARPAPAAVKAAHLGGAGSANPE